MQWRQKNKDERTCCRFSFRFKIIIISGIVIGYGVISSILVSLDVPTQGTSTGATSNHEDRWNSNFFVRSLRRIVRSRRTFHNNNNTSIESDPIFAVLHSALSALSGDQNETTYSDNESAVSDNESTVRNAREIYYESFNDGLPIGILSNKDPAFFQSLRDEIDNLDHTKRCERYGGYYNATNPQNRRIFYGALAASEPWELFEIVAAEVYGLYTGMVFVEGNRTQNFTPRNFQRLQHAQTFQDLFGAEHVQVRSYVNEDKRLLDLNREHQQRAEILVGWKELGMQPDDIGLLADSDETFTRDLLRAVQVCDGIDILEYEKHKCHHSKVKLTSSTRVYESTPECITNNRQWYHPDLIIGHCIEGITGNPDQHQPAPRVSTRKYEFLRAKGHGYDCSDWELEDALPNQTYSLWSAADFRRVCGGYMMQIRHKLLNSNVFGNNMQLDPFTGYHFHNFFAQFKSTRFKYLTYGHPDLDVNEKRIPDMSNDLKMMYKCAMEENDSADQKWTSMKGGYNVTKPFYPIYFQDEDYRMRRHEALIEMVREDEELLNERLINIKMKEN